MQRHGIVHTSRFRRAVIGALIGLVFPAVAFVAVAALDVGTSFLIAMIAIAPVVLGVLSWLIGVHEDRLIAATAELENRVDRRTRAIQSMLDVTGDGFLTIGADLLVRPEYSRPCIDLFGGDITGRSLPELLFEDERLRQELTDGLHLLFDGKARPEVIFDLLEKETDVGDRTIEITFRSIDPDTVMCALSDVSERRALEAQMTDQGRRRDLILRVVSNRKYFASFVNEAGRLFELLDAVSSHRSSAMPAETVEHLAAELHTLKGSAGFLGFVRTATVAHDLEDRLNAVSVLDDDVDLSAEVFVLKRQFYEEYNTIEETLGEQWMNDLATISVPHRTVAQLERYVKTKYRNDRTLLGAIEQLRKVRFCDLFARYPQLIADVAERKGRRVKPVEIVGGDFRVLPERYEPVASAIEHIARNLVDHGIESPSERELKGKEAEGAIRLELSRTPDGVAIVLGDDGRGVSFVAVEARARELGLINGTQKPRKADLLKTMFAPGFSTSEDVTMVSGRGIGLHAVQQAVARAGGKISVETRIGRGTTFRVTIPDDRNGE
ncbi:MAG: hypothetical protein EA382_10050 [Spirochaetaceae bacterium]|nr:MAG: hypothetical protein EA382_10050 [Spirochaetaceae bacterium]